MREDEKEKRLFDFDITHLKEDNKKYKEKILKLKTKLTALKEAF